MQIGLRQRAWHFSAVEPDRHRKGFAQTLELVLHPGGQILPGLHRLDAFEVDGGALQMGACDVFLDRLAGNDLGGSLRTPASFCSIVGLRPSVGRVAHGGGLMWQDIHQTLVAEGPLGRNVADVALMLDAQSGRHPRDPKSLDAPAVPFLNAARAPRAPTRIGYTANLGIGPVDGEVDAICATAARRFADAGSIVEEACPDFSGSLEMFQTLRAALFASIAAPLLDNHRDQLKPEMVWQVEKGMALSAGDVGRAAIARTKLYERVLNWFGDYDVLALPAAIVPPFDVDIRYVEKVGDHAFDNYVDWIYITYAITLTGCPAISIPAGFTASGLPVGIQLVGRPFGEAELLSHAAKLEEILGLGQMTPLDPITPSEPGDAPG